MEESFDVVIVGGGVAGLTAAYFIAKEGFKVAFIEAKDENSIGNKVCGDAVGEHHFIELGIEAPRLGLDATNVYQGVILVSPDEKHRIEVKGRGYSLDRRMFGYKLYKMALNAGAEGYLCHYFKKPVIDGSWVRGVVVKDQSGFEKVLMSRVVVDASGVAAVVRNSLPREWWVSEPIPKEDYCVTYREIVVGDIKNIDEGYAYIYLNAEVAPGGYWWLFPKGNGVYNIGLGLQLRGGRQNPRVNYDKYVKAKLGNAIREVIHGGGGLVPTRRPIPCMAWNGLIIIGDAAATSNPIHGGGIGSAMVSAKKASETITEALSKGDYSVNGLWNYHIRYHRAYGAKQASLDILRMFVQHLDNSDFNFVFKSNLVMGEDVYAIGYEGKLSGAIYTRLKQLLSLASRPSFLAKLYKLKQYMDRAYTLYLSYPQTPSDYIRWRQEEERLFNDFKSWLKG